MHDLPSEQGNGVGPVELTREPDWTPTHRHRKGGLYRVIGHAVWEPDRSPVVIYDDAEGTLWVRPRETFEDGRFQPL